MASLAQQVNDIGFMDTLSRLDTPVHRLDPRAKLLVTLLFCGFVVSFDRYSVAAVIPFAAYPVFLCGFGRIPISYILRKILWVSPFALMIAIFNPLLETRPMLDIASISITAGQLSFGSILMRFVLTVGATLSLLSVTGFYPLLCAADRLGAPKVLVLQLMFFFRYLFVLASETVRVLRARSLRSFGRRGFGLSSFGPLAGHLLLRTLDRAERIYQAMNARGFEGEVRLLRPLRFRGADAIFVIGWVLFFAVVRRTDWAALIGRWVLEWR